MIDIEKVHKIYFIGIGGIGMSALARYFRFHGREVSGYDKTETPLTQNLAAEGIAVHYTDDISQAAINADLVVYTPAVPPDFGELVYFRGHGYNVVKRSDVLGAITKSSFNICVAGTHGKTTISTMIAHLLRDSGYGANAFLGGISVNYNSNFWSNSRNLCVVEADEYDRSFLKLNPDIAVISAMDADHLDIYGTEEALQEAFIEFSGKVKPGGILFSKYGLAKDKDLKSEHHFRYHTVNEQADIHAEKIRLENGGYFFNVVFQQWTLRDLRLEMGGLHNVENALAAVAVAHSLGVDDEKIKAAVGSFKGVRRRFEYVVKSPSLVFIDDYAHHPEELRALISGAKNLFPEMKCTVIFQPHLFSRTKDFAASFAKSLDLADAVVLLPIYPAREKPMEGVTSSIILDKMAIAEKCIVEKWNLVEWVKENIQSKNKKLNLLITAGAGDIDAEVKVLKQILEN